MKFEEMKSRSNISIYHLYKVTKTFHTPSLRCLMRDSAIVQNGNLGNDAAKISKGFASDRSASHLWM